MADENKKEQSATGSSQGCRMNAKAVLQEQAKRMEKELESIETLIYRIPWDKLTADEEQNLWTYFIRRH